MSELGEMLYYSELCTCHIDEIAERLPGSNDMIAAAREIAKNNVFSLESVLSAIESMARRGYTHDEIMRWLSDGCPEINGRRVFLP